MGRVRYNQRGYVGCSMSVNAALAYADGERPRSKWTKAAMLGAIADYCDMFGIPYDGSAARFTKGWTDGMSDNRRAFCMGNALVTEIPHRIGLQMEDNTL